MNGSPLARQLRLLRQAPSYRLLFLATFGSGTGTWLAFVALTVDVYDRTHSGAWVSALLLADFLPTVVIGLTIGPLVDRLSRRALMVGADLTRFGVFCALPFAGSATAIVALAAVAGLATGLFRPAVYAGLPNLVADADLTDANSLLQTIENATWAISPVVGGGLVAASGPHLAYWVNAATFVVSASLLLQIPTGALQRALPASRGHWHDLAAGFSVVLRSRALLTVLVAWNVAMLSSAGVNVAEVVLAKVSFHAGDFGFGLLVGAAGVGLAAGSLLAGPVVGRYGVPRVYGVTISLMALGIGAAAAAPDVWVAAACVVVSGVGNGAAVVSNVLLVQRGASDEVRGRAFTVIMSSNYVFLGIGMGVAGPLTGAIGARAVWGIAASLSALAAAVGAVLVRGVPVSADAEESALPAAIDPVT